MSGKQYSLIDILRSLSGYRNDEGYVGVHHSFLDDVVVELEKVEQLESDLERIRQRPSLGVLEEDMAII